MPRQIACLSAAVLLFTSCAGDIKGDKGDQGIAGPAGANGLVTDTSNLALKLSSGTLTITDNSGASLSSSNPGSVTLSSKTPGRTATLTVAFSPTLNAGGSASSDLVNLGFGITKTADWQADAPFFLYAVNRNDAAIDGQDGNSAFFVSRSFAMKTTPAAAGDIGNTDSIPINDSQNVILLLGSYSIGNYTSLPCQMIGSFRMRWSASGHDWTVQTLNYNGDGIGSEQLLRQFSNFWVMPAGQDGAAAGNYIENNGGTAPVFGVVDALYKVEPDGTCSFKVDMNGDGGTPGSGSYTFISLPYFAADPAYVSIGSGRIFCASYADVINAVVGGAGNVMAFVRGSSGMVLNADFATGLRTINASVSFQAF